MKKNESLPFTIYHLSFTNLLLITLHFKTMKPESITKLPPGKRILFLVDRNIRPRDRFLTLAFRDFLFSPEAQRLFVKYGFRSAVDPSLDRTNPALADMPGAVTVDQMGGWEAANALVFEKIWKGEVLKELGK